MQKILRLDWDCVIGHTFDIKISMPSKWIKKNICFKHKMKKEIWLLEYSLIKFNTGRGIHSIQ